jgi:Questin oxidase-like
MNTLHQLLDHNLHFAAEYGGMLSNHLPMALQALNALGASDERLTAYAERYALRFEGLPKAPAAAPLADWEGALGRIDAFDALHASFLAVLQQQGTDRALRQVLPRLWLGVVAAAFHGVIRTAHAVQAGHQGEIAAGLAYWAARWQPLPAATAVRGLMQFARWSERVEAAALQTRANGSLISTRIGHLMHSPVFAQLADSLAIEPTLLPQAADWAASLYARSGNFTVLHMVTGARAVRVLWPWVEDGATVAPLLVRALTAAALASNLQLLDDEPELLPWDGLRAAAVLDEDEHVIKLVHACIESHAMQNAGIYQQAASRAVRKAGATVRACTKPP